jgi:hypothetical protein
VVFTIDAKRGNQHQSLSIAEGRYDVTQRPFPSTTSESIGHLVVPRGHIFYTNIVPF